MHLTGKIPGYMLRLQHGLQVELRPYPGLCRRVPATHYLPLVLLTTFYAGSWAYTVPWRVQFTVNGGLYTIGFWIVVHFIFALAFSHCGRLGCYDHHGSRLPVIFLTGSPPLDSTPVLIRPTRYATTATVCMPA